MVSTLAEAKAFGTTYTAVMVDITNHAEYNPKARERMLKRIRTKIKK
jgi:hypothetical protein